MIGEKKTLTLKMTDCYGNTRDCQIFTTVPGMWRKQWNFEQASTGCSCKTCDVDYQNVCFMKASMTQSTMTSTYRLVDGSGKICGTDVAARKEAGDASQAACQAECDKDATCMYFSARKISAPTCLYEPAGATAPKTDAAKDATACAAITGADLKTRVACDAIRMETDKQLAQDKQRAPCAYYAETLTVDCRTYTGSAYKAARSSDTKGSNSAKSCKTDESKLVAKRGYSTWSKDTTGFYPIDSPTSLPNKLSMKDQYTLNWKPDPLGTAGSLGVYDGKKQMSDCDDVGVVAHLGRTTFGGKLVKTFTQAVKDHYYHMEDPDGTLLVELPAMDVPMNAGALITGYVGAKNIAGGEVFIIADVLISKTNAEKHNKNRPYKRFVIKSQRATCNVAVAVAVNVATCKKNVDATAADQAACEAVTGVDLTTGVACGALRLAADKLKPVGHQAPSCIYTPKTMGVPDDVKTCADVAYDHTKTSSANKEICETANTEASSPASVTQKVKACAYNNGDVGWTGVEFPVPRTWTTIKLSFGMTGSGESMQAGFDNIQIGTVGCDNPDAPEYNENNIKDNAVKPCVATKCCNDKSATTYKATCKLANACAGNTCCKYEYATSYANMQTQMAAMSTIQSTLEGQLGDIKKLLS